MHVEDSRSGKHRTFALRCLNQDCDTPDVVEHFVRESVDAWYAGRFVHVGFIWAPDPAHA